MLENAINARKCKNGRKVKSDAGKFFPNAALINLTPLPPKISTPYNSTKTALKYINKGLFYSPRIGL
jgi:hypothetical protein